MAISFSSWLIIFFIFFCFFVVTFIVDRIYKNIRNNFGNNHKSEIVYYHTLKYYYYALIPIFILGIILYFIHTPVKDYYVEKKKEAFNKINSELDSIIGGRKYTINYIETNVLYRKIMSVPQTKQPKKEEFLNFDPMERSVRSGIIRTIQNQINEGIDVAPGSLYYNDWNVWYYQSGRYMERGEKTVCYMEKSWQAVKVEKIGESVRFTYFSPNICSTVYEKDDNINNYVNLLLADGLNKIINKNDKTVDGTIDGLINKITKCSNYYYKVHSGGELYDDIPFSCSKESIIKLEKGTIRLRYDGERILSVEEKDKKQVIKDTQRFVIIAIYVYVAIACVMLSIAFGLTKAKRKPLNVVVYQNLLEKCNPIKYINPYDDSKVKLSNEITNKLLSIEPNNKDEMSAICDKAQSELHLQIISPKILAQLRKKVNPKRFIKPYDVEKIDKANELYKTVSNANISYKEALNVEEMLISLMKK